MQPKTEAAEASFPFTAYDVAVDRPSVKAWDLGTDGTGYAVQLAGPIDDRWARSFYVVRTESKNYARFHLDPEKRIVWFACRQGDRPKSIQPVLDALGGLVSSVNAKAESDAWSHWGEGSKV
jgi:hypothetical protein